MNKLVIAIFAHSSEDFNRAAARLKGKFEQRNIFLDTSVQHCDSRQIDRLVFLKNNLNKWILFLDADCELTNEASQKIFHVINSSNLNSNIVLTGYYENSDSNSYLQRVHNFIANCWIQSAFHAQSPLVNLEINLLGGIFLIYTCSTKILETICTAEKKWGAEDKILSHKLIQAGYKIEYSSSLRVIHTTTNSWVHFFRRAFLQGLNDPYKEVNGLQLKSKIRFWNAELKSQDVAFLPAVLLHFLCLGLGKSVQRFLPKNK